jgi:cytochrome c-type biogenesis protein CcmH
MRRWLLLLAMCWLPTAHAAIDPYDFNDESQRERYRHFIEEMRCPKCQNQNLAGSDAPIAQDLRRELHRLLVEGRSDREIVDFMVARYGAFILYDPPFDKKTALLWLAPLGFLVVGGFALLVTARRRAAPAAELSAAERARLDQLLRDPADERGDKR